MLNQKNAATLGELLRDRALAQPERKVYTFLADGEHESGTLTYQELDRQARAIAARIQSVITQGDRVLVVYPYTGGLEFIAAFFGCLYAGAIAVTTHPPRHKKSLVELQQRILDSGATVILTTQALLDKLEETVQPELSLLLKSFSWIATDTVPASCASDWQEPNLNSDTIAYFQYTSGSTGTPKGVMVTHGNALHNSATIRQCFEHTPESRAVMWLPFFHDMGLIGGVVQPLYADFHMVLMSPVALIQKPLCWLQAVSRYEATTSGGPNFAYDLACDRITPEQRHTLDLSHWDLAFSGAEPVRPQTLQRFAATFASCGFRPQAFYPCYGMAETTLLISGGLKAESPIIQTVDDAALQQNRVVPVDSEAAGGRAVVGCGRTWLGDEVRIVDPDGLRQCEAGRVGEIWVSGAGVAKGYWNQPHETEQTFRAYLADTGEGPFLRTGDLGFLQNNELFITGRLKEVMIFWGNLRYPQPIELTVQNSHPALRLNGGAAFSIEVEGEERLVIAQEVERTHLRQLNGDEVIGAIRRSVAEDHIVDTYAIVLLKPGTLPKTSSGKVQRRACRTQFLDGNLEAIAQWQEQQESSILELLGS